MPAKKTPSHSSTPPSLVSLRRCASLRLSHGWMTTSTSAMTISTGTIAVNALAGNVTSRIAPMIAPRIDAGSSRTIRSFWPLSSSR